MTNLEIGKMPVAYTRRNTEAHTQQKEMQKGTPTHRDTQTHAHTHTHKETQRHTKVEIGKMTAEDTKGHAEAHTDNKKGGTKTQRDARKCTCAHKDKNKHTQTHKETQRDTIRYDQGGDRRYDQR